MRRILTAAALSLAAASTGFGQATGRQADKSQAGGQTGQAAASPTSQLPAGWGVTGNDRQNYELTLDTSVRHGGRSSASLRPKSDPPSGKFGSLLQEIRADQYRGKRLRFSGYVKGEGVMGKARLWMRVDGEGGKTLTFDNMEERAATGTFDWQRQEIVLDVPAEAQLIAIGALFDGKGRIWVDDLRLEAVGADVASTDMTASPGMRQEAEKEFEAWKAANKEEFDKQMQRRKERLPTMRTEPANLDFEVQ